MHILRPTYISSHGVAKHFTDVILAAVALVQVKCWIQGFSAAQKKIIMESAPLRRANWPAMKLGNTLFLPSHRFVYEVAVALSRIFSMNA